MKIRDDINVIGGTPGQQVVEILEAGVNVIAVGWIIVCPVGDAEKFLEIERHAHRIEALTVKIHDVLRSDEIAPISVQDLSGQVHVAAEHVLYRRNEGVVVVVDSAATRAGVCIIRQAEIAHHVKLRPEPGTKIHPA